MRSRVRVLLVVLPSSFPADHQADLLSETLAGVVAFDRPGSRPRSVTAGYLDSEAHPAPVAALLEVIGRERTLSLELVGAPVSGSAGRH